MQDTEYEDAWADGEDGNGPISEALEAARKRKREEEERVRREYEDTQKESE